MGFDEDRARFMTTGGTPSGGSSSSGGGTAPTMPIHTGCTVVPRIGGTAYFPALKAAMTRPGVERILVSGWWLDEQISLDGPPTGGGIGGQSVVDLLKARAAAGVDVRVMGWMIAPDLASSMLLRRVPPPGGGATSMGPLQDFLNVNFRTIQFINALRTAPALADKAILNTLSHPAGAVHVKGACVLGGGPAVAFTGGIDLQGGRWLTSGWHDIQAEMTGGVAQGFFDFYRQMWEEIRGRSPSTYNIWGVTAASHTATTPALAAATLTAAPGGTVHGQSLRTVPKFVFPTLPGIAPRNTAPSFAPNGVTEVRDAWAKAISGASKYIYIEDQGFTSTEVFDWINARVKAVADLKVILLIGGNDPTAPNPGVMIAAMQDAVNNHLLAGLTPAQRDRVGFFGYWRKFVHAKTTIVDDLWAMIGSANCMRRSLYTDFEHSVGFMDSAGTAVPTYRRNLWRVHLGADHAAIDAGIAAWFALPFRAASPPAGDPVQRFRLPFPSPTITTRDRFIIDNFIDADARQTWGPGLADLATLASGAGGFAP